MILRVNGVEVNLENVTEDNYNQIVAYLNQQLPRFAKNCDAVSDTFFYAIRLCPDANPSDLWHHIIYRQYLIAIIPTGRDPGQSWKRVGGDALEEFFCNYYTPLLSINNIRLRWLLSKPEKKAALIAMGCSEVVGEAKLDTVLEGKINERYHIFGGAHIKTSLAERVSDDEPTSRAMKERGYFSPLLTLDMKSFPPPRARGQNTPTARTYINIGELGTVESPTVKRKYIENQGIFDDCYSYNLRTIPSNPQTPSGKRVIVSNLNGQPDSFVSAVVEFWTNFRQNIR